MLRCEQLGLGWQAVVTGAWGEVPLQLIASPGWSRGLVVNVLVTAFSGAGTVALGLCYAGKGTRTVKIVRRRGSAAG